MIIKGNKTSLKRIELKDIDFLYNIENDPELNYLLDANPNHGMSLSDINNKINSILKSDNILGFIIMNQKTEKIGVIYYYFLPGYKTIHFSIRISKGYWNKGYGYDSLKAFILYIFNDLKLHRIESKVCAFNHRALHLYKKLGFKEEGVLRKYFRVERGKFEDNIQIGLLEEDFLSL